MITNSVHFDTGGEKNNMHAMPCRITLIFSYTSSRAKKKYFPIQVDQALLENSEESKLIFKETQYQSLTRIRLILINL